MSLHPVRVFANGRFHQIGNGDFTGKPHFCLLGRLLQDQSSVDAILQDPKELALMGAFVPHRIIPPRSYMSSNSKRTHSEYESDNDDYDDETPAAKVVKLDISNNTDSTLTTHDDVESVPNSVQAVTIEAVSVEAGPIEAVSAQVEPSQTPLHQFALAQGINEQIEHNPLEAGNGSRFEPEYAQSDVSDFSDDSDVESINSEDWAGFKDIDEMSDIVSDADEVDDTSAAANSGTARLQMQFDTMNRFLDVLGGPDYTEDIDYNQEVQALIDAGQNVIGAPITQPLASVSAAMNGAAVPLNENAVQQAGNFHEALTETGDQFENYGTQEITDDSSEQHSAGTTTTSSSENESSGSDDQKDSSNEDSEASDDGSHQHDSIQPNISDSTDEIIRVRGSKPEMNFAKLQASGIGSRLQGFLAAMEAANSVLEDEKAAGTIKDRRFEVEDTDTTESGQVIEMNLGLGVLEEKKAENSDSDSSTTEDDTMEKLTNVGGGHKDSKKTLIEEL